MAEITMTVQEALNKKKIYEDRLVKMLGVVGTTFVTTAFKKQEKILGMDREKAMAKLQSNFDSIRHIMDNLTSLKVAINASNATTKIAVAGVEYTIADAIAKLRSLDREKEFFNTIAKQYNNCIKEVDHTNEKNLSPDAISAYVTKILTGIPDASENKKSIYDQIVEEYKESATMEILDPIGYDKKLDEWKKELDDFEAGVHTALITSNVSTMITVELKD